LMLILIVVVLSQLGVPTTSLVAILGASSLAVGLALRNFLSNIAASFVMLYLKPFQIGDYVKIGNFEGSIVDINLFTTHLKTITNEALFIPNNKIMNDAMVNNSYYKKRRVDLPICVSYDSDIAKVKAIILDFVHADERVLKDPAPEIITKDLADSAIILSLRIWLNNKNLASIKSDMLESIKAKLDQAHISIPFPQLDVHVTKNI